MTVQGNYYDGQSAKRHRVELRVEEDIAYVTGESVDRSAPLGSLHVSEQLGAAPRLITFADGAFCEIQDHAALNALLAQTGYREHMTARWQRDWRWIAASAIVCIVLGIGGYFYGLPLFAKVVANTISDDMASRIGHEALDGLDGAYFKPTQLPEARRHELTEKFRRLTISNSKFLNVDLEFRASKVMGPNAFALPGNIIVVTDALVNIAKDDNEIMGVLAHEAGHLEKKHGLRLMVQASAVGVITTAYIGDISSILASVPAVLLQAKYSRNFESEADRYGAFLLRKNGISPHYLGDILERLGESRKQKSNAVFDYLASHPMTEERVRELEKAENEN
ncbi:MAG: M48 family metallopeptidase [Pseudomonadota bacterium]